MSRTERYAGFELSLHARPDGSLEAAYVYLSHEQVVRTEELVESVLMVDYDANDQIVGIEILAPVPLERIVHIVDALEEAQRQSFHRFLTTYVPSDLVLK
jgi:uncharacterized protein YuzE